MDITQAKQIGQSLGVKSTLIGIITAYAIMVGLISIDQTYLEAFLWFTRIDYWLNILVGVLGLIMSGYVYGGLAGINILINKKDYEWIGIAYGFLTLWTGTILGSTVGFLDEGLDNIGTYDNPFVDYYFKPLFWVTFFGFIPVIIVGLWFGRRIKMNGKKVNHENSFR